MEAEAERARMARKLSSDRSLFAVTAALLGLGLVMVWSASSALAQEQHGNAYHFLIRQALWACVGLAAMAGAMRIDYRRLRQPSLVYAAVIATTALLILVLFLHPVNETHRWIRLGALSFQPAELAKPVVILFLAYHLERKGDRIQEFLPCLFPVFLLLGWFGFLIFIQPDLGSAATLVVVGCVMLFLAGVRLRQARVRVVIHAHREVVLPVRADQAAQREVRLEVELRRKRPFARDVERQQQARAHTKLRIPAGSPCFGESHRRNRAELRRPREVAVAPVRFRVPASE
jgi:cell division protein FtsW (lipid II flippase)